MPAEAPRHTCGGPSHCQWHASSPLADRPGRAAPIRRGPQSAAAGPAGAVWPGLGRWRPGAQGITLLPCPCRAIVVFTGK
jgi:hypothetical protein